MPEIFVFGGCNGSGKTTFSTTILSSFEPSIEFVNADLIAAELNPLNVDSVALQASRLMLERLKTLSRQKTDFAFETTLAARSFAPFLKQCKNNGYQINLFYIWLNNYDLAIERVAKRVAAGGHNIPQDTIIRRYQRGRNNFFELYSPLADYWIVYDNSQSPTQIVAEKIPDVPIIIFQSYIWQQIAQKYYEL